ncbi:MAG TPA: sulfatase, partial [Segetibacter sp.]
LHKTSITVLLIFLLINPAISKAQQAGKIRQPNIILIFADDLGYMDVGYNGSDYYETPNIDKLAKQGMRFTNGYASGANCAPSRACMLSGAYTPRHQVYAVANTMKGPISQMRLAPVPNHSSLATRFFTMAEALKAAGYTTGIFGKWHLGDESDSTDPASQGFDVVMESGDEAKNRKLRLSDDPKGIFEKTEAAKNFITANKDKPFFAYVSHNAVHGPHQAKKETYEKFKQKKAGTYHGDPLYAACIYDFDTGIGELMDHLDKLGLAENTFVLFTSDNGGTNITPQEPLRGNKGAFYEGGIREPLIVRWTGKIAPGTANHTPVINLDFYPTFAALAGAKLLPNQVLDGVNILPLLNGKQTIKREQIYWHFPGYLDKPVIRGRDSVFRERPVTVMRKGDFKIFLYHEEWVLDGGWQKRATNRSIELFNLKKDPGERKNLAVSNAAKRDEMLNDLLKWMKTTDAKMATVKTPQQQRNMKRSEGKISKGKVLDDDN